jgi:hypothetical protein
MVLPNRMSLRPILLWLTLNLTDYSVFITKHFFLILHTPQDVFAYPQGYACPDHTTDLQYGVQW